MTTLRTYSCNLCGDKYAPTMMEPPRIIGLKWGNNGWSEADPDDAETHICCKCLVGLQMNVAKHCGAGFKDCPSGLRCGSDHK